MSRLGKVIWQELEAAMHVLAGEIRKADFAGMEAAAREVEARAHELAEAVAEMRRAG